MAARSVEICQAVAESLVTAIADKAVTVERTDIVDPDFEEDFKGRTVYVVDLAEGDGGPATRATDYRDYTVGIITLDRYKPYGERPSQAWVDSLKEWVVDKILDTVNDLRNPPIATLQVLEAPAIVVKADPEMLALYGVFMSEIQVTYREEA